MTEFVSNLRETHMSMRNTASTIIWCPELVWSPNTINFRTSNKRIILDGTELGSALGKTLTQHTHTHDQGKTEGSGKREILESGWGVLTGEDRSKWAVYVDGWHGVRLGLVLGRARSRTHIHGRTHTHTLTNANTHRHTIRKERSDRTTQQQCKLSEKTTWNHNKSGWEAKSTNEGV